VNGFTVKVTSVLPPVSLPIKIIRVVIAVADGRTFVVIVNASLPITVTLLLEMYDVVLTLGEVPPGTPGLPTIFAASEFNNTAVYPNNEFPPFLVVMLIVEVMPDSSKERVVTEGTIIGSFMVDFGRVSNLNFIV
jgi:hypothetical protein